MILYHCLVINHIYMIKSEIEFHLIICFYVKICIYNYMYRVVIVKLSSN